MQNWDLSLIEFRFNFFILFTFFGHDYWFKSETKISTISVFARDYGRVQSIGRVSLHPDQNQH